MQQFLTQGTSHSVTIGLAVRIFFTYKKVVKNIPCMLLSVNWTTLGASLYSVWILKTESTVSVTSIWDRRSGTYILSVNLGKLKMYSSFCSENNDHTHISIGNSDIKLLYVISKFETISKYHDWYLCQISRTNHAIICLYYYPQKVCNFHM